MARPSTFSNGYYQQTLRVLSIAASALPFAVIGLGLLAKFGILDNRFYAGDLAYWLISGGFILASLANGYFTYLHHGPSAKVYLGLATSFHVLAVAFLLFVSGVDSPFLLGWIPLVIATDYYFGLTGTLISLLVLCLTAIASLQIYRFIDPSYALNSLIAVLFVCATAIVLSKIRAITDRERIALSKTRDHSNFQRERLLALVNSMGDAVITTDEQGIIKVYNAATLNLLDTNEDLTDKNIDGILKFRDNADKRVRIINEATNHKGVFSRTDLSHHFGDNDQINLYVNVAPVQPSYRAGGERGFIFILRDITKEKTLEQERDEFISVVSHELRTPVAIAEGGLSNIILLQQRGAAADVMLKTATAAHDQILYLSKLINDLSALSRAERGLGAEIELVDLGELLHNLYNNYLPQAQAKGLKLNLDSLAQLPKLLSSRLYLEEILQNLVTNSLKYTKAGSITIRARNSKNGIDVSVSDTGIGIGKADQKHIFEKFYRSEDYRTRESNGTGLGLYVCKKLAEKIGLSLTFESRLNHGTTFSLSIPSNQIATGDQVAKSAALPVVAGSQPDNTHSAPSN